VRERKRAGAFKRGAQKILARKVLTRSAARVGKSAAGAVDGQALAQKLELPVSGSLLNVSASHSSLATSPGGNGWQPVEYLRTATSQKAL
jgi:hypothetical protein